MINSFFNLGIVEEVLRPENLFLVVLALVWIVGAVIQDFRKREVANWWNFSLIAIALAYRGFLSVFLWNYWYIVFGVAGALLGFALANAFYYARVFAGGDAKLLMGLGAVLGFSLSWVVNLKIFGYFCILFLLLGSIYSLVYSFVLVGINFKDFKKEFRIQFKKHKKLFFGILGVGVLFFIIVLILKEYLLLWFGVLLLMFPILIIYAKGIESCCMIKKVNVKDLTVGDWLAEGLKVGKEKIKPNWEGVSEDELALIQKKYKGDILVKQGIPFTPAFLLGLVGLIFL